MDHSIENIWKTGFITEGSLVIPRIQQLYKQKSKLTIDKMRKTYRIDNALMPFLALASALGFWLAGLLWIGFYIGVLLMVLFELNRRQLRKLDEITPTDDLFEYLNSYLGAIKRMIRLYTWVLGLGTPMLGIPAIVFFLVSRNDNLHNFVEQEPWYVTGIFFLILAAFLSAWGILAYRATTQIIYGKHIGRLKEIISDIKQLREEKA